jgi:hypothetical protein
MATSIKYTQVAPKETNSVNPPDNPARGDRWNQMDANSDLVMEWVWNGTLWRSRTLYQQATPALTGQGIIIGGTVGLITGSTDNLPIYQGNDYDILLYKLHANIKVPVGNLSAINSWDLQFRNTTTLLQTLSIAAGNGGETTGFVSKSSAAINVKYPKLATGYYNIALIKNSLAPNLSSPSVLVEYWLARP